MSLPVLNTMKQKITVPVINKEYTIRPYLVGEEKALLIAMESKDIAMTTQAVKNLISSCVEEKINVDELSSFETEFIFLQLRKISVNNVVEVLLTHPNDDSECKHAQRVAIDLDSYKTKGEVQNKIILDEDKKVGVVLKIPTNKILSKEYSTNVERIFGLIESCITTIFDEENVYDVKDVSKEELTAWINSLNNVQIKKITDFFGNLPSLYYDVEYTCDKCHKKEKITIEGISNFL